MKIQLLNLKIFAPVFLILNLFFAAMLSAQTIGDYRSSGNGNWTTLSSWQYYNGSAWVTPTGASPQGYPGQFAGTGTVTIRDTHTITINASTPNNFTSLVIGEGTSGTLVVGADISVLTLDVIINTGGIMTFSGQNEIHFPVNSGIKIYAPGKIDTSATCTNNVAVYIGAVKFGVCVGSGNAEFSFTQLNTYGGTLFAVPTSNSPVCQGGIINLFGSYSGPTSSSITYGWSVKAPDNSITTNSIKNTSLTGSQI